MSAKLKEREKLLKRRALVRKSVKNFYDRNPSVCGLAQINKRLKKIDIAPISMGLYKEYLKFKDLYYKEHGKIYSGKNKGFLVWFKETYPGKNLKPLEK